MREKFLCCGSRMNVVMIAVLCGLQISALSAAQEKAASGQLAPLLDGLSDLHHPITTKSKQAQKFFDQGLRLVYAFNHAEAIRSFKEAQRLDPECAMAYWGEALALGPNLNVPLLPENAAPALAAAQKAQSLATKVSDSERALIDAISQRYSGDPKAERAALDRAYADAMGKAATAFPKDDDAVTLHADSVMNLMPWNYYTKDGQPRAGTNGLLNELETVMARNPKHIGALHLYIHATEEHYPQKAEKAADMLLTLTPMAGHLVHMPSHTYVRLGRYADAYESNRRAVETDERYIAQCKAQGVYPMAYYPHNIHFLMWAAERQGRADEAIFQARKVSKQAQDSHAGMAMAFYESFYSTPLHMMVRFGKWEAILAEPVPADDAPFVRGVWHFARALAQVHLDNLRAAGQELKTLREMAEKEFPMSVGFNEPKVLLTIAASVVEGEIAAAKGKYDAAVASLDRAVRLEDSLTYNEPPDWPMPSRQILGAVLFDAGRAKEAEVVYWADLKKNTENGFALFGLWKALEAQPGREDEAATVKARFEKAWAAADHAPTSSRY